MNNELAQIEQTQDALQLRAEQMVQHYLAVRTLAHDDHSPTSDLKAATLASSLFLSNFDAFDQAMDATLHHLEQASLKSRSAWEKNSVQCATQELLTTLVYFLERKLELIKQKNSESIVEPLKQWLKTSLHLAGKVSANYLAVAYPPHAIFLIQGDFSGEFDSVLDGICTGNLGTIAHFATDSARLATATFEYMLHRWKVKKQESALRLYIAHAFLKVLKSGLYQPQFTLMSNTYQRIKGQILPEVLAADGISNALKLMEFDASEDERANSGAVMVWALCGRQAWEALIAFAHQGQVRSLNNYSALCQAILNAHAAATRPKSTSTHGALSWALLIGLTMVLMLAEVHFLLALGAGIVMASAASLALPSIDAAWQRRQFRRRLLQAG